MANRASTFFEVKKWKQLTRCKKQLALHWETLAVARTCNFQAQSPRQYHFLHWRVVRFTQQILQQLRKCLVVRSFSFSLCSKPWTQTQDKQSQALLQCGKNTKPPSWPCSCCGFGAPDKPDMFSMFSSHCDAKKQAAKCVFGCCFGTRTHPENNSPCLTPWSN